MASTRRAELIKDIVLHLSTRASADATIDYAVSVAIACEAHLTGAAFALDPFVPPTMGIGDITAASWIDEERAQGQAAAKDDLPRLGGEFYWRQFSIARDLGIGMAYVPADRAEPGTELEIDVRGRTRTAVVRPKPLYTTKER